MFTKTASYREPSMCSITIWALLWLISASPEYPPANTAMRRNLLSFIHAKSQAGLLPLTFTVSRSFNTLC